MARTDQHHRGREAGSPTEIPPTGWKDVAKRTVAEIKQDHVPIVSAGVAFYGFLALFPALIALIALYGLIADPATVERQISEMSGAVSPQVAAVLAGPLTNAATGQGLTFGFIASLAGVLWSASSGVNGLVEGINIAYDEDHDRTFVRKRGLALLLTLGAIVFVTIAVGLIAVVPIVLGALGLGTLGTVVANLIRWPLLAALLMLALAVVYKVAPAREDPELRWATPGSVVATVLWLIGSALFSVYVNNFGSYDKTYGALGGVVVLMLWLFLSALIVLIGAEINAELEAQTREDTTTGPDEPMGQRDAVKADELGEPT